jgi:hypothetical protein
VMHDAPTNRPSQAIQESRDMPTRAAHALTRVVP